mmetsp:Transcript_23275/g.74535  ORF Transcript_23275/g.74535 Transcript_23275/m.74535 type:complete len:244 (+) Transcript_23275:982-1713(+)
MPSATFGHVRRQNRANASTCAAPASSRSRIFRTPPVAPRKTTHVSGGCAFRNASDSAPKERRASASSCRKCSKAFSLPSFITSPSASDLPSGIRNRELRCRVTPSLPMQNSKTSVWAEPASTTNSENDDTAPVSTGDDCGDGDGNGCGDGPRRRRLSSSNSARTGSTSRRKMEACRGSGVEPVSNRTEATAESEAARNTGRDAPLHHRTMLEPVLDAELEAARSAGSHAPLHQGTPTEGGGSS